MSQMAVGEQAVRRGNTAVRRSMFFPIALGIAASSAFLAGWAPVRFSIATVFVFAGPHNWFEARYFLTRLPARWGKLRPFFLTGFAGTILLAVAYAALPWLAGLGHWNAGEMSVAAAIWNTALIAWVTVLIQLRSRTNPRRDWSWTGPVAIAMIGASWLGPAYFLLGTIYLHPLIALWILDRELRHNKPEWHSAFRWCLACLPVILGALWWRLAAAPNLAEDDVLTTRITWHAGAKLLPAISSHLLVATHAFLEMLHYGVWVLAIPLVGLRAAPWTLGNVPLARRAASWRACVAAFLFGGAALALGLWVCFAADYALTRDIYFTVALLHVLAEAPFLLRAL
jgi:hypothetical protein